MGVELLEIGVKVRKGVIFTIRGCFRLVCNHPFLVGVLCFLIFLYRSSPFIFQLLVSASPVLVCTAVLLGTLLSLGQPNIPEIEIEEKTTYEAALIKSGVSGDTAAVEKNESYYVERFSEKRWDEAEQSTGQPDLSAGKLGVVRREDSDDTAPLIEERSLVTGLHDGETWQANRELGDLRSEQKTEWLEERLNNGEVKDNHYASPAKVNDELESDDENSETESFGSEKVNVDSLDSPPPSPWTWAEDQVNKAEEEEDDDEDDEEDASDSGSGRAESSSPDASMADIMPMLDELHPLLDEEAPRIVHLSHDGSDAASEKSPKSSTRSHESDDETENHEDLEVADDEHEDGEDDEDAQGDKEEQSKSAITWTEEDQKNLMDLGSSEIERNQRLENLILRRRARKMLAERNLIDFESSDLPFNLTPISTRRQNPFDLPLDNYDNSGLPPVPGSAPSVLAPRRNPFDIPYDSNEEKPDLMADGFQEEFATPQPREPIFRRFESFNVGPSIFAPKRQDVKMRPYFVPEGTISEELGSSLFQRQSSELSDSKVSSVPETTETESIGSVEDPDDRKLPEEDNMPEVEVTARAKDVTEEGLSGYPELISKQEVDTEEDVHREPEMVSKMESVSENVGQESQSSEEEDSLELGQVENRDVELIELKSQLANVADHCEEVSATQYVEVQGTESHSSYEAVERRYTRDSSSSSLSEVSERVFTVTEVDGLSMLEGRTDGVAEEPAIFTQTSIDSTDLNITGTLVNDVLHREPLYDTSPRELSKNVSSSSISSDVRPESDLGLPSVLDKITVPSIGRGSEGSSQEIEADIPSDIRRLPDLSISHPVDESRPVDGFDIRENDIINTDISGVDQRSIREGSSAATDIAPRTSIPLKSSEEACMEQHRWDEVPVSSDHINIDTLVRSSKDRNLEQLQEDKYLLQSGDGPLNVNEPPYEDQLRAEHSVDAEDTVQSPNTSLFHDKAIHEPNFKHLNELQASSALVESFVDGPVTQELNMPEVQQLDHYILSRVDSLSSPEFISIPSSSFETTTSHVDLQTIVEEADEIKEIDDALLSELDNVGDFSIKHLGSDSSEIEKHIDSVGESLSSSHHTETGYMRVADVDSVEVNKIQDALHSENSREHIDIYEEDVKHISEQQTSETSRAENIEVSRVASNRSDGQVSPYLETSGDETLSKETEVQPGHSLRNHNYVDTVSGIPELEVQSTEDVDAVPNKAELTSVKTEIMMGGAEASCQSLVNADTTSEMTELEATTIEDIDLAFKQISSKEIKEPDVLEPFQAERHNYEDTVSGIAELEVRSIEDVDTILKKAELTSVETEIIVGGAEASGHLLVDTGTTSGMPVLEASKIEDIDLAFKQITDEEIEKPVVLEPPEAELHKYEDIDSGTPELEVQSIEDVDSVPKKSEFTSAETEIMEGGAQASYQGEVDTDATSGMTELKATAIEDIDLAFRKINTKEIEKPVVSEPSQADLIDYEGTVSRVPETDSIDDVEASPTISELTSVGTDIIVGGGEASCQAQINTDTTSGMTELEASKIEDIDLAFKQISSKEIEKAVVSEHSHSELVVGEAVTENSEDGSLHVDSSVIVSTHETSVLEAGPIKDATIHDKQLTDGITGSHTLHDSIERTLHVVESGETQSASSELHVTEPIVTEGTILPPNQVLDVEKLKPLDGSVDVKAEKVGPSKEESSVKENSAFPAEKPDHEVEAPNSPLSGKGKSNSKSSSSSSSSSSESSSSDSDKE